MRHILTAAFVCSLSAQAPVEVPGGETHGNDAVEFVVTGQRRAASYGPIAATAGTRFLIVATEWRNRIPTAVVDGKVLPVPYLVPDLAQQLFLVVDGMVVPFANRTAGRPGVVPQKKFLVPDPDLPTRGNLVFEVAANARVATLLFADDVHGAFTVPLLGNEAASAPLAGPVRNELVEASVLGMRGVEPGEGMAVDPQLETIAVDLRVRSVRRRNDTAKCASLVDWPAFHDHVLLLVDGDRVVSPSVLPLPKDPRFLPELGIGGELHFVVPRQRQALTLVLTCPELPSDGGRLRPEVLQLSLAGAVPAADATPPLLQWEDQYCQLELRSLTTQSTAAGPRLVGEFRLVAKPPGYEVFRPREQLLLVDAKGEQSSADATAPSTAPGAPERLLVPPAASRRFVLAWPVVAPPLRLAFRSSDPNGSRILALPAVAAPGTATEPAPPVAPVLPPPATEPAAAPASPPPPTPPVATKAKGQPDELPRLPIRSDRTPRGIEGVGLTAAQVNASIDRGCVALWNYLTSDRRQRIDLTSGPAVLAALALVHAGFHKKDAEFDATVRNFLARREPWNEVYVAGLIGMLIEAYGDPEFLPLLRLNTEWLVNCQLEDGSWGYHQPGEGKLPPFFTPIEAPAPAVLRSESSADRSALLAPVVRHPDMPAHPGGGDNSVTQYALLGLDAAARLGLRVPESVWRQAMQLTRARQCRGGGWDYNSSNARGYGSMTAAAVCALAFADHYLEQPLAADVQIEQGLAWLAGKFSVTANPDSSSWIYYWLYSMERVGRLLDIEFVGPHEWYPLGARHLIDAQQPGGLWKSPSEYEALATPFALLFLTRATPKLKAEAPTGPGQLLTKVIQPPGRKLYVILDASGSMLEEVAGRTKFDIARAALGELVQGLPDATEVALRVYGHRKRAIEDGADEDCELVLPMGRLDKAKFAKVLAALRPRGKTPLALSIEQSLGQVTVGTGKEPLTLLLLTDGGEDTKARRDPVAAAKQLAKIANLRFRVVGFDIERETWQKQLAAMTAAGNGRYVPALRTQSLLEALRLAALDVPSGWVLLDAAGAEVGRGKFGDSLTLPPGDYVFRTARGDQVLEAKVVIRPAGTARVTFDANG
ncbi:MAG: VWA domain-containing protein [Planctomycetes bacterium]|nr:VWA domain-containing protein [Planctomycetota bacterium]